MAVEVLQPEMGDDAHNRRAMVDRLDEMTDYTFRGVSFDTGRLPDVVRLGEYAAHMRGVKQARIGGIALGRRFDSRIFNGDTSDFVN